MLLGLATVSLAATVALGSIHPAIWQLQKQLVVLAQAAAVSSV
jgi:hypothetical protein